MLFTLMKIAIAGTLYFTIPPAGKNTESASKQRVMHKVIPEKPKLAADVRTDTVVYFYSNRKVSVKISPWKNGERKITVFDPNGQISYSIDDTRQSYSSISTIYFRPDGSVEKISIDMNPGASRYWYNDLITFSNQNEPEWKRSEKFPKESLDDFFDSDYYWDKTTRQWKKQEVIECQPVPKK